jgi:hypothetical protein
MEFYCISSAVPDTPIGQLRNLNTSIRNVSYQSQNPDYLSKILQSLPKRTVILQYSLVFTPSDNKTLIRERCPGESTSAKHDACQLITTVQKTIQTDRLHAIEKLITVKTNDFKILSVSLNAQHKPTEKVSTTHTVQYTHSIPAPAIPTFNKIYYMAANTKHANGTYFPTANATE